MVETQNRQDPPLPDVRLGGRRRIDRVLGPDYLDGLKDADTEQVRAQLDEAGKEAAELGYLRRQLDERVDVVTAEQRRRNGEPEPDAPEEEATRRRRFFSRTPPEAGRPERLRRRIERLVTDVDLADVTHRTDDELARVLRTYQAELVRVETVLDRVEDVLGELRTDLDRRAEDAPEVLMPNVPRQTRDGPAER